jgi:hypothetical protein
MIEASIYLIFCLLTALCGTQRRVGFLGTLVLAVILTPLLVLPILLLTGPSHKVEWHRRMDST